MLTFMFFFVIIFKIYSISFLFLYFCVDNMYSDDRQPSMITDNTYRIMNLDVQAPPNKQRYHNITSLKIRLSILALSSFYWGYCLAYLSTIPKALMIEQYGHYSEVPLVRGFLVGVLTLGAALGAFCSPFLLSCFTRRQTPFLNIRNLILILNFCALIVACIIQFTNLYCLYVCRLFQGFIVGNLMALISIYIDQLTPKEILSTFGVFTQLFSKIGLVVAFGLGAVLVKGFGIQNQNLLRIMLGFDMILILVIIVSCLTGYIPQSPNSLIMNGQNEEAKKVINMFIKSQYVEQVFNQKLMDVEHQRAPALDKQNCELQYSIKAYFIGFLLPFMKEMTGDNAIASQVGRMVEQHQQDIGYYIPLIINAVQMFTNFGAMGVLNHFGRRTIILTGNFGQGLCNIILGVLLLLINQYPPLFWLVFVTLIIFMVIHNLTLGPIVWMYVPEIMPGRMVPFATTLYWVGCSITLIVLPIIQDKYGIYAYFFIFGGITLTFAVINFFGVIETKNLTRKQICEAYQGKEIAKIQ